MKIKILKGECLFNEKGTHIIDSNGFACLAQEDTECEVFERIDIVLNLLAIGRAELGLDAEGNPVPEPEPLPENEQVNIELNEPGVENGLQ